MSDAPKPDAIFGGSLVDLRDQALMTFNICMAAHGGVSVPQVTDTHRKYLTVEEVEAVLSEKADDIGCGFVFGADSPEGLAEQLQELMFSLVMRIRSNILHEGVKLGYLEVSFDDEKNDFVFDLTEKGRSFNAQQFQELWGGADFSGEGGDDDTDSSPENN